VEPFREVSSIAGKHVLLAEDDAITRRIMASILRAMELEVVEVVDGGRMLVAVTSQYKDGRSPDDIDLVVTDVRMPVASGLDVFSNMRAAGWRTPVIIVTADETPRVRDTAAALDAVLLLKPLDLELFEHTVRSLLAVPHRPHF